MDDYISFLWEGKYGQLLGVKSGKSETLSQRSEHREEVFDIECWQGCLNSHLYQEYG